MFYFRHLTGNMRILLALYFVFLLAEWIINYQAERNINNLWIFHVITILEYTTLTTVFIFWQKSLKAKNIIRLTIPIYLIIWILAKFSIEDFTSHDNFTASLSSVLLTCITLFTLLTYMKIHATSLQKAPWFWVSVGVLIYHTGNFFVFSLSTTIFIWGLHNCLNIIANLCIAGGFLSLRH